ncbi:MAG: hypothetical protein WCV87_03570 [Candidatus Paceibacterota bacterium]
MVAVLVMAVALTLSLAVFANDEYYDIGSNPMAADRPLNPDTEAVVKITADSPVLSMIGGGGKVASGKKLKSGEIVVVDKATHIAKWVWRCGNEIPYPTDWIPQGPVMFFTWKDVQSAPIVSPVQDQPQQPPTRQEVDINVHQDQRSDSNSDQPQEHGFWDMVAASFVQALAQGIGQGMGYRMVWDGGPGYGGSYGGGFAPIVYYPSPSYYGGGGGGGDVFITKNITKTFYVNSFNSSSTTTITNPGGPRGGGGGGPVDPPADPGSGTGGGGGPVDPGTSQARNSSARAQQGGAGVRKPMTEAQIARDFRGQSGSSRPQAHGPTVGNDAWTPSARGGNYQQRQQGRGSTTTSRQNTPRYGTQRQPSRGWSAPTRPPASAFRGGGHARPSTPAFRGGGGYTRPSTPAARGGGGYARPSAPASRGRR